MAVKDPASNQQLYNFIACLPGSSGQCDMKQGNNHFQNDIGKEQLKQYCKEKGKTLTYALP